ncbi:MAG: PAS domain S-box protein [Ignavibacteriales bacterium]|nr:PAS domain S-box protein [Ignavibacteriales bacterium]
MQTSPVDIWWAVILGSLGLTVLTVTIISIVIANQRKFIKEQKKQMSVLQKSEKKYRSLFEELKDAILVATPEGTFLDANPACIEMLGYSSKDELFQSKVERDIYPNSREREVFEKLLLEKGVVRDFELTVRQKDGELRNVMVTASYVNGQQGGVASYRKIFHDITERKKIEEQLRQSQKMESIATLASGIAHDFNNILGIIAGYTGILEKRKDDPEKFAHSIEAINRTIDRSTNLVKQLLTFARKSDILLAPVNVNGIVSEITKLLIETFPRSISFLTFLEKRTTTIFGDHNQLHQALLNLCVNARDAIGTTGSITIRTEIIEEKVVRARFPACMPKDYVCISVTDTGSGMSEQTRKRIFEPFFTTKEKGKGTGLGLSVVFGIVENYNGYIDVESELGKGTTFRLYFPAHNQSLASDELRLVENKERNGGTETILVVEDEELLLDLVRSELESAGYHILTASDGAEAVEVYKQHKDSIDIVISDMGLPKIEGMEAFHLMKAINPKVRFILASGYIEPILKEELLAAGAKAVLHKPYTLNVLQKTIQEVLVES